MIVCASLPFWFPVGGFLVKVPRWGVAAGTVLGTLLVAALGFHLPLSRVWPAVASGMLIVLPTLSSIGCALLFYESQRQVGTVSLLVAHIHHWCPQREVLVLLCVLGVSPVLEALCGFGTGMLVCLPLLLSLDLSPRCAALLALLGEGTTAWANMSNAIVLEAALTGIPSQMIGEESALLLLPLTLSLPLLALWVCGADSSLRRWWPLALLGGGTLALGEWAGSLMVPDLAGLLAGLSALVVVATFSRLVVARTPAERRTVAPVSLWRVLPGGVLLSGLWVSHLVMPVRTWLGSHLVLQAYGQHVALLSGSTPWMLLGALGACLLTTQDRSLMPRLLKPTWERLYPLSVTLLAFGVAATLMQHAGMLAFLGQQFGGLLKGQYLWCSGWLGALGSVLIGSNAGSNVWVMALHHAIAERTGLPLDLLAGIQNAAASLGRLLSPTVLLLVSRTTQVREDDLLHAVFPLVVFALLGVLLVIACLGMHAHLTSGWPLLVWGLLWGVSGCWCLLRLVEIPAPAQTEPLRQEEMGALNEHAWQAPERVAAPQPLEV